MKYFLLCLLCTLFTSTGTASAQTWTGGGASTATNALRCVAYSASPNPTCGAGQCTLHGWPFEGVVLKLFTPGGGVLGSGTDALILLDSQWYASVHWGGFPGLISYTFRNGSHATCLITNQANQQQTGTMVWQ